MVVGFGPPNCTWTVEAIGRSSLGICFDRGIMTHRLWISSGILTGNRIEYNITISGAPGSVDVMRRVCVTTKSSIALR